MYDTNVKRQTACLISSLRKLCLRKCNYGALENAIMVLQQKRCAKITFYAMLLFNLTNCYV